MFVEPCSIENLHRHVFGALGTPEGLCMHTGLELIIRCLRPQVFAVAEIDGARYTTVNNRNTPD